LNIRGELGLSLGEWVKGGVFVGEQETTLSGLHIHQIQGERLHEESAFQVIGRLKLGGDSA